MARKTALVDTKVEIESWTMSDEHKLALAEGRMQGKTIREYLDALNSYQPKRGRKRSPESIQARLLAVEEALPCADSLTRLKLVQERLNLEKSLVSQTVGDDLEELQSKFIEVAAAYGERKGITYAAWRSLGVPVAVLKAAGVSRTSIYG